MAKASNVAHWGTRSLHLSTGIVVVAMLGLAPLLGWALAWEHWMIVGALIMVILVPIVIRWPVMSTFGLYAFLVSFDTLPILAAVGGTTLTKPVGMLAGAVLVVTGLMERRLVRPPLAALWWGLFVVWSTLSTAWAINPDTVLQRLPTVLSLFLFYVIAVSVRPTRRELSWVCVAVVVGGAIAAGLGYAYGVEATVESAKARGTLAFGDHEANPNALGATLILPLALAIAGVVGLPATAQRVIAIGLVGLIGAGIFISMSRAALVAVLVTLSVLVFRMGLRRQIVIAALALLALAGTMPARFYQRVNVVLTGEDATGAGRIERWTIGLEALESFGVVGAGLRNFTEATSIYVVPRGPWGRAPSAHNSYLMVWVELGIGGLALMLAASGSHLLAAHRARKAGRAGIPSAALEAACVGMLAVVFFGDRIWMKAFWLPWILLTWATRCDVRSDQASDAQVPQR